jgi:hypothetical protein
MPLRWAQLCGDTEHDSEERRRELHFIAAHVRPKLGKMRETKTDLVRARACEILQWV